MVSKSALVSPHSEGVSRAAVHSRRAPTDVLTEGASDVPGDFMALLASLLDEGEASLGTLIPEDAAQLKPVADGAVAMDVSVSNEEDRQVALDLLSLQSVLAKVSKGKDAPESVVPPEASIAPVETKEVAKPFQPRAHARLEKAPEVIAKHLPEVRVADGQVKPEVEHEPVERDLTQAAPAIPESEEQPSVVVAPVNVTEKAEAPVAEVEVQPVVTPAVIAPHLAKANERLHSGRAEVATGETPEDTKETRELPAWVPPRRVAESAIEEKPDPRRPLSSDRGDKWEKPLADGFRQTLQMQAPDRSEPVRSPEAAKAPALAVGVPIAESKAWAHAMNHQVIYMMKNGLAEAKISINPEHLGPVNIDVSIKGGVVNVGFASPYQEVRDLLSSGLDNLRSSMNESGVQLGRVEVKDALAGMAMAKEQAAPNDQQPSGQQRGQQQEEMNQRREEHQRRSAKREFVFNPADSDEATES